MRYFLLIAVLTLSLGCAVRRSKPVATAPAPAKTSPAKTATIQPTPAQNAQLARDRAVLAATGPANVQCPAPVPTCAGGLLPEGADAGAFTEYQAKFSTKGCRFTEPPRCATGVVPACGECTP